jgi:hypothetical protein
MAVHILRDFTPVTSGYTTASSFQHVSYLFSTAVFLNKVLGYSIVGHTGFDLNNTNNLSFTFSQNTAIAAASNGQSLPQATINVVSTTGFPASGLIYVTTSDGVQLVKYSGTTATTFTNCTGGTGTMSSGFTTTIAAASNGVALPTATINVASTTGFPTSGTIYVVTSAGVQTVTYTGTTATTFTGCSGGTGTMSTGNSVSSAGIGGVACGPNRISTASGNPLVITTQFPHGMNTGEYLTINNNLSNSFYGFNNSSLGNFGPYKVEVVSSNQLRVLWTVAATFVANTASILPQGLLIASGTVAGGTGASINFGGAPSVYAVQVPTTVRTVVNGAAPSAGDTGRILVLKSSKYPTKNSGLFKITATNTATNSYTIDYRSTDTPPPETMDWWLYETETRISEHLLLPNNNQVTSTSINTATNTTPIQITINLSAVSYYDTGQRVTISGVNGNTAANGTWTITRVGAGIFTLNGSSGNGNYTSGGTVSRVGYTGGDDVSPNSRIILQSPHSSGWQVRIAGEPWNISGSPNYASMSIGYGGSIFGDFPVGGVTTHIAQYLDSNIPLGNPYSNTIIGSVNPSFAPRITIVGDDTGRAIFLYARPQGGGSNGFVTFGLPDNEPTPLPANSNRPFIYGGNNQGDYGTIQARWGINFNVGFTYRDFVPEMCGLAGWANADGISGTSPVYAANAGDCPFTTTTEVLPWELWGGVATDPGLNLPFPATGNTVYGLNQRLLGTAPFIRQGRTNFGAFIQSTENTASLTVTEASNTSPIQITTSAANSLTTGQTVVISGVNGNTAANGTFVITVVDSTHFTLNGTTGNGAYTSGGTVNGTARWIHLQNGIYLAWNGAGGLVP